MLHVGSGDVDGGAAPSRPAAYDGVLTAAPGDYSEVEPAAYDGVLTTAPAQYSGVGPAAYDGVLTRPPAETAYAVFADSEL